MKDSPNIVLIVTDDQGFADLSCYGSTVIHTPNLDRMAREGIRFTDFHMSAAQCTPSRASILTGSYPQRVNLEGVLIPGQDKGLSPDEITLPGLLQTRGYATALFGKWHLGDGPAFNPVRHGFDEFVGIPYSNNMKPQVLLQGNDLLENPFENDHLTERFTRETLDFIERKQAERFFVALWHPMPHMPLGASESFRGVSGFGPYGDAVMEIDHSVGRVLEKLRALNLDQNTLVIFTSDNGPWQPFDRPDPEAGGSAFPYRGSKANEYEGGLRVPFIAWGPGMLEGGQVNSQLYAGMDLYTTLARLGGAGIPTDRTVDGLDIWSSIQSNTPSPREVFFYYHYNRLDGVRKGPWKLMLPRTHKMDHWFYYAKRPEEARNKYGPEDGTSIPLSLYHLEQDPSETENLAGRHPEIVEELTDLIEAMREDLGDERVGKAGCGRRPAGKPETPARLTAS